MRAFLAFSFLASLPVLAMTLRPLLAGSTPEPAAPDLPTLGQAPPFELTERDGEPFQAAELTGKVWVADFIFTYCAGPCPLMTSRMAELQKAVADLPDVRLVSFSVDPERDTPQVLRRYADRYGADPERWFFLTGDEALIRTVAVNGFKLGSMDDLILHSAKFALVDRSGAIRGYYDSSDADVVARLAADIRSLGKQ
ncbi:MAG: SCO family protein [bacterium]|nr:SCO family protein [bacterium]